MNKLIFTEKEVVSIVGTCVDYLFYQHLNGMLSNKEAEKAELVDDIIKKKKKLVENERIIKIVKDLDIKSYNINDTDGEVTVVYH